MLSKTKIRTTTLWGGEEVPVLGQGTWRMGDGRHPREEELRALRLGIDLGMSLIDTAEMYGDGASEELVGEAIRERRDEVFLVSKVLPSHATRLGTIAACEASLRRLRTQNLDLYLLHWRGSIPLQETIAGFEELVRAGKIRYWGVSNFDLSDMQEVIGLLNGKHVNTDQVLYNPTRRGIESNLLPWCQEHRIPIMAYSPIEQGRLRNNPELQSIANRHGATPAQVALAWVLRQDRVIAIPQTGNPEHVRQNRAALTIQLTGEDLAAINRAFPPPKRPQPLEML